MCVASDLAVAGFYLERTALGRSLLPIPALPLSPFRFAPAFATFCLAKGNASLFAVRQEEALLFDVTQHAFALYDFAESFEQLLL